MTEMRPVLIIGAGVSGLTVAQGLHLHRIPFRIFERRPKSPIAQGHRFRVSKDARTAVKSALSPEMQALFEQTAASTNRFKPRYVDSRDFVFNSPIKADESDSNPIDRSWLRSLLLLGIEESVEYEKNFESFTHSDTGGVQVLFRDGTTALGSLLVGADGVGSRARKQLQPCRRLLDLERWIVWGRTPLTEDLRSKLFENTLSWYMVRDQAANTQAVIEPMIWSESARQAAGDKMPVFEDYIYWAVATPAGSQIPQTAIERQKLLKAVTESWHPQLRLVLLSAPYELSSCLRVVSSKPDIELQLSELTGVATLVGDAAHAMSPMGGSGATTALENAADLAATIARHGTGADRICQFEQRMAARAKMKIDHSFDGGRKFWLGKEWHEYSYSDL